MPLGSRLAPGSDFGKYTGNSLTNNNVMNVNTPGTNCGTSAAVNCSDDSGAFGVLINGNDNEFSGNTVSGSTGKSYDYNQDGGAFEIYNGNRNNIHHNVSLDNNNFSELGKSSGTADGNTFRYNLIRSTCGANCSEAKGLIARGNGTSFGPTNGTVFEFNTVYLTGTQSQAIVCHATCPASTVIRANILVGVKNSLWINGSGWTEKQNVLNGPVNITPNSTSTHGAGPLRECAGGPPPDGHQPRHRQGRHHALHGGPRESPFRSERGLRRNGRCRCRSLRIRFAQLLTRLAGTGPTSYTNAMTGIFRGNGRARTL